MNLDSLHESEQAARKFTVFWSSVLQPMDTTENWPRVGLEAMSSGSVLIVDDRGGWRRMIDHGKTGWLCSNPREFIYGASQMAFEPNMRADMAAAAKDRLSVLAGRIASIETWTNVFEEISKLPE
jgi:glycosyltransferase involved in cell wall biosynthesis